MTNPDGFHSIRFPAIERAVIVPKDQMFGGLYDPRRNEYTKGKDMTDLSEKITASVLDIPQLKRGIVWCEKCGRTQAVDSSNALAHGWPECCGYTMTIDSPEERGKVQLIEEPQR